MKVKFHRIPSYAWNFQNFTCVFTILVKFDIHFLGLPWEIFFGVTTDDFLPLVQGFCLLKIKITQFPGGFLSFEHANIWANTYKWSEVQSLVLTRYNQKKGFYNWAAQVSLREKALKSVLKEFKQVIASYY